MEDDLPRSVHDPVAFSAMIERLRIEDPPEIYLHTTDGKTIKLTPEEVAREMSAYRQLLADPP